MWSEILPKFERPPVIETVLGVQFDPISGLKNAHLGAFWKRLGADWPNPEDVPAVPSQFEKFTEADRWIESGPKVTINPPDMRLQIRNASADRMIQAQNGRFHYNWLGQSGSAYPRYKTVRPEFDTYYSEFKRFLSEEGLEAPIENQWEVTYVNHIPKGSIWNDVSEWSGIFSPAATLPADAGNARLSSLGGESHYEIEPERGRLHIRFQHGRKRIDEGPELLVITLTARGSLLDPESNTPSLSKGLDLGRATIVQAFHALTSDKAHEYWGEIHD